MSDYAISNGSTIINVVVSDNIDEVVSFFSDYDVFETSGRPWIGWTLEEEGWREPSPYPSWLWSGNDWEAPIEKPENTEFYIWEWDEEILNWKELAIERIEE